MAIARGWVIYQLEVKKEFLNGPLGDADIMYVHPPDGINLGVPEVSAFKLNNAL